MNVLGVIVQSDAGKVLGHVPADIAVVSVATFEPTYPVYLACIDASIDVISTDDQATHPWALYPDQSIEIDRDVFFTRLKAYHEEAFKARTLDKTTYERYLNTIDAIIAQSSTLSASP